MPFVIHVEDGRHVPRIYCGACGTLITEVGLGGVVYPLAAEGARAPVRVLCKERGCLAADPAECWQELSHWLLWLLQNGGVRTLADFRRELEVSNSLAAY
jgi:hypothetical protein